MSTSLENLEQHARHLRGVAYRMLGSLSEAEDILQEARLRWLKVDESAVSNPRAYLTQMVTRLCLDLLGSARYRREEYVGPWLPEPLLDPQPVALASELELAQDVGLALLLTLQRLTPLERAAYLLHDILEVSYEQVAATIGRETAATRKLTERARSKVSVETKRPVPPPDEVERVLSAFQAAVLTGNVEQLQAILAEDCVFYSDGGGKVKAATKPVVSASRVARFILGLVQKQMVPGSFAQPATINGMPGLLLTSGGTILQTTAIEIAGGQIQNFYSVGNPDKLGHLQRS